MEILLFGLSRPDWGCHSERQSSCSFRVFCTCFVSVIRLILMLSNKNGGGGGGREDTAEQNMVIDKCRNTGGHYKPYTTGSHCLLIDTDTG